MDLPEIRPKSSLVNVPNYTPLVMPDLNTNILNHLYGPNSNENTQKLLGKLAKLHATGFALKETNPKPGVRFCFQSQGNDEFVKEIQQRLQGYKFKKTLCVDGLLTGMCKNLGFVIGPPVYNALQGIFATSDEELRREFYWFWVDYYHQCLHNELKEFGLEVDEFLSGQDYQIALYTFLPVVKMELSLWQETDPELGSLILTEDCYAIIRNAIDNQNYNLKYFHVKPFRQSGGYLGDYHKLELVLEQNQEELQIYCFVKTLPIRASAQNVVLETGCFFKEDFFYRDLVRQIQDLGVASISECVPKCYFQRPQHLMVFEDLGQKSFVALPPQAPYDVKLLRLSARKLAKFHASLLAFEEKKTKSLGREYRLGNEYPQFLHEVFFLNDQFHSGALIMQAGARSIPDVLSLFPSTAENQADFAKTWAQIEADVFKNVQASATFRNVLCHGDLWSNNIMVKFEDQEPVDCRFIDFQCTRYCPPAHDLLALLYLTTNRANRKQYTDEIKEVYHEALREELEAYELDVNDIYSHQDFLRSYEFLESAMVLQTIFYYTFIMCVGDDVADTMADEAKAKELFFGNRKAHLAEMCAKSAVFEERLGESVLDLYDFCHLLLKTAEK